MCENYYSRDVRNTDLGRGKPHPENKPHPRGNRPVMLKKPATERGAAQGMSEKGEVSFPD